MPSILQRLKAKKVSSDEKKQLLKEIRAESYKHEKERVALENKKKRAEEFVKEMERAEKAGIEKARMGGKTVSVKSLLKSAESTLGKTEANLKKAEITYKKAEKIGSKALDILLGPSPKKTRKKPATKKKVVTKKKTVTKKKPVTKKKK